MFLSHPIPMKNYSTPIVSVSPLQTVEEKGEMFEKPVANFMSQQSGDVFSHLLISSFTVNVCSA